MRKAPQSARTAPALPPSMGPQPFGCGRRRLTAESSTKRNSPSMGPQPFGCGRACMERTHGRGVRGPSMGPQPFGCGRYVYGRDRHSRQAFNGAATFRLRKDRSDYTARAQFLCLQWGRNLSVAEGQGGSAWGGRPAPPSMGPQPFGCGRTSPLAILPSRRHGLQWGRNLSVAEGVGA